MFSTRGGFGIRVGLLAWLLGLWFMEREYDGLVFNRIEILI